MAQQLMCVTRQDDLPLQLLHGMRQACRQAVQRDPCLAAALLFTGNQVLVMIESSAAAGDAAADALAQRLAGLATGLQSRTWVLQATATDPPDAQLPALRAGSCCTGYLDAEGWPDITAAQAGMPDRVQAFLAMLDRSDHD